MSDIVVSFKAKGEQGLLKAIKLLDNAQKGYTKNVSETSKKTQGYSKKTGLLVNHQRLLNNSFATMRSNLLLINFALGLGIKQLAGYAKEAAKLESVNRAFVTMSGSARAASVGLHQLREATNNTMSDFDLFRQANSAMLLGITDSTSEMAEMFDMSQRLGRALGNDTVQSVEALIFGLGRMSVKRLDDIGIIVKANQAYRDYATANNTIVSKLTESQKRQAFFNAALESGREKLASMGPEILGSQDKIDQLNSSFKNLRDRIGIVINEAILPLTDSIIEFNKSLDTGAIKEIAKVMASLGSAIAFIWVQSKVARVAIASFGAVITATKVAVVASIGGITMAFRAFFAVLAAGTGGITLLAGAVATIVYSYLSWNKESKKVNEGLEKSVKQTTDLNSQLDDLILKGPEASVMLMGSTEEMIEFAQSYANNIRIVREEIKKQKDEEKALKVEQENRANLSEELIAAYNSTEEAQRKQIQATIDEAKIRKDLTPEELAGLDALIIKIGQLNKVKLKGIDANLKAANAVGLATKNIGEMVKANSQQMAAIEVTMSLINAYGSFLKTMNSPMMIANPIATKVLAYSNLAAGIAASVVIAQQASKLGASGGGGGNIPVAAEGGYIGGRLHSQGGTIIEAERGEFIMSRNATESIGLETLNQMNQQGGAGNINVSVTGNVLTQDFVEGELAESIKEAIRKGSDFGIG